MKYKLNDGDTIVAENNADFVEQLRITSRFDEAKNATEYMLNFAKRAKIYSSQIVDTTSFDTFVESLKETKIIISIE